MGLERRFDFRSLHWRCRYRSHPIVRFDNSEGDCESRWVYKKHALDQRPIPRGRHCIFSTSSIANSYPKPLIEANWGDTIQVTVNNNISGPAEGTAMHWHGINQQGTEWADGVPGVSMCPVPPGGSFTHTFKASPYGSTFYHSHYSSQYADGLWGPIVGPNLMLLTYY